MEDIKDNLTVNEVNEAPAKPVDNSELVKELKDYINKTVNEGLINAVNSAKIQAPDTDEIKDNDNNIIVDLPRGNNE